MTVATGPCAGVRLWLTPYWRHLADGHYDQFIYDALNAQRLDLTGAVAWDVGAHLGYHTLALARLVGAGGRVFALEPNPHNVAHLQRHLEANPELASRVSILPCALHDSDGQHVLRMSATPDSSAGSYLDTGAPPSDRYGERIYANFTRAPVPVRRADTLVAAGECLPPRFLKLDVEGAETAALRGARELLSQQRPALALEVHSIQCMLGVSQLLHEHGYRLHLLDDGAPSSSRCFVLGLPG
jgi:FkbM family methyltransferase